MGSQRRKLVWATANTTLASVPFGTAVGLDLTGNLRTAGASVLGGTVIRTHLRMQLRFANTADFWTIGLGIFRDVDVAAGVDVNTNPGDDWMLATQYFAVSTGATVDANREIEIDIRSKRKFEELEQRYALMVGNHTGANLSVPLYVRTLIALP
jgi:hypothetical protein